MAETSTRRQGRKITEPNAAQAEVLEQLTLAGADRAELAARKAYMTTAGRRELDEIYSDVRYWIVRGSELGIRHEDLREALGVSPNAYYKIKRGETGPGER